MNMENFIREFKIYCETVENTRGLEKIKQYYFDYMLNLEIFVDDYIRIDICRASNEDIIKEVFDEVMQSCYSQLYKKVYPNEIDLYKYELEESDLPKWYIDLCNILDKYGI